MAADVAPQQERVLLVRLPCNPIFPIGPIYLADHLHKCFPEMPQRILDLAALPGAGCPSRAGRHQLTSSSRRCWCSPGETSRSMRRSMGGGGNPLQNSFEVFYARNPLKRLHGALGGLQLMSSHYGELRRNQRLVRQGLKRARRHQPDGQSSAWRRSCQCVLRATRSNRSPKERSSPSVRGSRCWRS